ncbi:MAG: hypothetical protein ABR572_12755 [Cryomorphaceae bacterium]|nr:hypothetical protein [Flavobacteriales bacterium]
MLEQETIKYFFGKTIHELHSGTRLNNSTEMPYIKKRLAGSGGFRFYFLLIIKNDSVYLMFVHPKTGPHGADNITDESKAYLYKKVLHCIENNVFYSLTLDESKKHIHFDKAY